LKAAATRFAGPRLEVTLDVMMARSGNFVAWSRTAVATAAVALSMIAIAAPAAWSQAMQGTQGTQGTSTSPALGVREAPPQAAPQPAQPAPPPPGEDQPGLIDEMGKLFEKSLSILPKIKSPSETIDDLNARAKDAGDSLSNLAKPSTMVSGRAVCPVAANGAPDCKMAADKLCQSKGFKEGQSLNMDSAQSCSAKVLIPGRARKPDDCRTDNFVTRAVCQ
jgi:hypothetical protein